MGVPRKKFGLTKEEAKKTYVQVLPIYGAIDARTGIRKDCLEAIKKQGGRLVDKNDPIKHPGLHRLAMLLNRLSCADVGYFGNNWDLDPVCVYAYELAEFFNVQVEFENPKDESRENQLTQKEKENTI